MNEARRDPPLAIEIPAGDDYDFCLVKLNAASIGEPTANWKENSVQAPATRKKRKSSSDARGRILRSAYQLFSTQGVAQVGIDTIIADSGCAKASLYNNFSSKEALALAFMEERELIWTRGWLEDEIRHRADDPQARLLAIFDIFGEWFVKKKFEGCSFINVLLESEFNSPIHRAAARHLSNIRSILRGLAIDAGLDDCDGFAQSWHILMKGSIVAACEGNRDAAGDAKKAAQLVLKSWPRRGARH